MSAFKDRIAKADNNQKQVFAQLAEWGFDVAVNGTEHHYPDFVNKLRQSKDQTSLAIRFQPDGVVSFGIPLPHSCFLDVKAGITIEKDAWIQYQKIYSNGNILILTFGGYDNAWNFLQNLILIPAYKTIEPYKTKFPIDDDGWIAPRRSLNWEVYLRFKNPQASGTSYREVDRTSLKPWESFVIIVKDILCLKEGNNNGKT